MHLKLRADLDTISISPDRLDLVRGGDKMSQTRNGSFFSRYTSRYLNTQTRCCCIYNGSKDDFTLTLYRPYFDKCVSSEIWWPFNSRVLRSLQCFHLLLFLLRRHCRRRRRRRRPRSAAVASYAHVRFTYCIYGWILRNDSFHTKHRAQRNPTIRRNGRSTVVLQSSERKTSVQLQFFNIVFQTDVFFFYQYYHRVPHTMQTNYSYFYTSGQIHYPF